MPGCHQPGKVVPPLYPTPRGLWRSLGRLFALAVTVRLILPAYTRRPIGLIILMDPHRSAAGADDPAACGSALLLGMPRMGYEDGQEGRSDLDS